MTAEDGGNKLSNSKNRQEGSEGWRDRGCDSLNSDQPYNVKR